jgi:hypothetical protein
MMVAVPVTLWKLYMTKFMVTSVARWVILPLLVTFFTPTSFCATFDRNLSGFDPIFFLHHANVDRMLSLWAAVNIGVWVTRGPAEGGTWTISGNAAIDDHTSMPYSP